MSYAPDSPIVVGSEWLPKFERGFPISASQSPGVTFTPGVLGANVVDARLKFASVISSPTIVADVIRVADLAPLTVFTDTYVPTRDGGGMISVRHGLAGGTVAPFWPDVDESPATPINRADFIANDVTTQGGMYFGGAAAFPANRRVISITMHFVVKTLAGSGSTTIVPAITMTGGSQSFPARSIGQTEVQIDDITTTTNPTTGLPWTAADVISLSTTGAWGFDHTAPSQPAGFALYATWITVVSIPENRYATGQLQVTADGWTPIPLSLIGGGASWNFEAAKQYLLALRIPSGVGSAVWKGVEAAAPHPDFTHYTVQLDSSAYGAQALGVADNAAPAFGFRDATGLPRFGQPYCKTVVEEVASGHTVQQDITLPDNKDRGSLAIVANMHSRTTIDNLVARMRRRSDLIQIGGDLTVTPNEVRGAPRLAQVVTLPFLASAVAPAALSQIYVELSSVAAVGRGWDVVTVSTDEVAVQKLTANQQGVETDATGFFAGASTAIVRSLTKPRTGVGSLEAHWNAGGSGSAIVLVSSNGNPNGGIPVLPGVIYALSMWHADDGANHHTVEWRVSFYNAAQVLIGASNLLQSQVSTTAYQQWAGSLVAPAAAAWAVPEIRVLVSNGADLNYFDDFSVTESGIMALLGIGGATDRLTVAGVVDVNRDLPVSLFQARVAPVSLVAVAAS